MTTPATIAASLSDPQKVALERMARSMVWIDGRSRNALARRKLVTVGATINDALLGTFPVVWITPLGREVHKHLQEQSQ